MAKRGNGEGTIYFSEKLNKWVGQFTAGRKTDGKLNRKSVYGNTRKEVKEKITKALSEVQKNTYIDEKCTLAEELGHYYMDATYPANTNDTVLIAKQEYRAKKWSYSALIPFENLKLAVLKRN